MKRMMIGVAGVLLAGCNQAGPDNGAEPAAANDAAAVDPRQRHGDAGGRVVRSRGLGAVVRASLIAAG